MTTSYLGTVFNPYSRLEASLAAIASDIATHAPTPQTNSEKVQDLFTALMDGTSLVQGVAGIFFLTSSAFYVRSYFSPIASILSPLSLTSALITGIIAYDCSQTFAALKNFNHWILKNYPNHDDTFILNDSVYNRYRQFHLELKSHTWVIEPLARGILEETTVAIRTVKQSPLEEDIGKVNSLIGRAHRYFSGPGDWKEKTLGVVVYSWSIVRVPFKFVGTLWARMKNASA